MSDYLLNYHSVNTNTWVYLSSLLMIGLFFKFGRFWSVRNLDLVLLIFLAPGLLLVHHGQLELRKELQVKQIQAEANKKKAIASKGKGRKDKGNGKQQSNKQITNKKEIKTEDKDKDPKGQSAGLDDAPFRPKDSDGRRLTRGGYIWVLVVSGLFLGRLLADSTMVRRPLLDPNLSTGGLIFLGCSLFVFLMANLIGSPGEPNRFRVDGADGTSTVQRQGPGYAILDYFPPIRTFVGGERTPSQMRAANETAAKILAIASHLAIVMGMVVIGFRHFENTKMGLGAALIYLMLPYTAQMTGRVDHVLPAAMLVWAVVSYRHPIGAGIFIGLATGMVYYPLFLLPLWISFYWRRGVWQFVIGLVATLALMAMILAFVSNDLRAFGENIQQMFGLWRPAMEGLQGVWGLGWSPFYRLPVLALFFVLSGTLAMWPAQKNLGTLLCCSAAVMVAIQFWHGFGGGLYMAWYLPLTLLTIFRPNLEDRVALSVLGEGWFPNRRAAAG